MTKKVTKKTILILKKNENKYFHLANFVLKTNGINNFIRRLYKQNV